MTIGQIWEVATLIIIAVAILIVGIILLSMQRKIKSVLLKNIVKVIALVTIISPSLLLLYTLIRAIIFIFFYYN